MAPGADLASTPAPPPAADGPPRRDRRPLRRAAIVVFYALLALLCAFAVARALGAGGLGSAWRALFQTRPSKIGEGLACVVAVFAILWLLERAALKVARTSGSTAPKVWRALIANALSLGSGFGALSGGALRARLYAPFGVDTPTAFYIASVVTLASLMGGGLVAASALLLTDSFGFGSAGRIAGAAALTVTLALIVLAGRDGRTLRIAGVSLTLPDRRQLIGLVALGAADWFASAATLFVLLPDSLNLPFPGFVMLFTLSHYVAIATGAPAGLGVFDALVLTATGGQNDADKVAAALLVYRIIAFASPVGLAALGLWIIEAGANRANDSAPRGAVLHWILQHLMGTPPDGRSPAITKGELFAAALQQTPVPLADLSRGGPILVLAPHPDDDVLGCGGLIAACAEQGVPVHVAYLTDGRYSHIGSRRWSSARIAAVRREEAIAGAAVLGLPLASLTFVDATDSTLFLSQRRREAVIAALADIVARHGIRRVFSTWVHDPHFDHVAAALVADALLQRRPEVDIVFYPIWGRLLPESTRLGGGPWRAMRFDIGRWSRLKRAAVDAHRTQTTGLIEDAILTMPAPPYSKVVENSDEIFFVREPGPSP